MRRIDEREIAKQAALKLGSALKSKTQTFADHINRPADKASIKDVFAKGRIKKYGLKKNGNDVYFMRSLSIKMAKHGFIRHFGVNTTRSAGSRTRTKPHNTTYHFKQHMMKQPAKPFLDAAISSSGVVDFVAQKVGESRADLVTDEIVVTLKKFN